MPVHEASRGRDLTVSDWWPGRREFGAAVFRAVLLLLAGWGALALTIAVLPGVSARAEWDVLLAAAFLGLLAAALRPLFTAVAAWLGWAGVFVGWLLTQAVLMYLVLSVTPGMRVDGFWDAFWASWLYAIVVSIVSWFVTAGDDGAVAAHLLRSTRRSTRTAPRTDVPGVVMIQIDGLSAPLARWAVQAGNLPTLSRWIRSGGHLLAEWHAELPATTPASQAGLLHGASAQVPAFRWWEKRSGRLVVTNHPRDSALIESRMSDGRGLLADGGVSLSNIFSGDAATSMLTMSTVRANRARRGPARSLSAYVMDPFGLTRSLVLTGGEMVKELYQGRRQRARRIEPRVHRGGTYVLLRGVTNVLLRELNTYLVAEHLRSGVPVLYCDFVDYDEIAHHAGPTRPESLASLEGIDRVLGTLERIALAAPRPYRFVVLSDHGQSQGATFLQRYGERLEDVVRQLLSSQADVLTAADAETSEQQGRVNTLIDELGAEGGVAAGLPGRVQRRRRAHAVPQASAEPRPDGPLPELVVAASGNLGLVYFPRVPGRLTLEDIQETHPRLLSGLAAHPGIGFVMVRSRTHGPLVLGSAGIRRLDDDHVEGVDPLVPFGLYAADDLRRHDGLPHVADILVNSRIDASTGEVAAFEELVGCHGGLGGWQSRAVLVHPADWPVDSSLVGADAVHQQLVVWLDRLGLRASPARPPLRWSSLPGDADKRQSLRGSERRSGSAARRDGAEPEEAGDD
ncbi:phage holin family protein [Pseudonocardia alaniniphila]|uniref:Phage holin family protein n=1 Tax=Pseudonocardia alaniniphila TaxID=75291 RepID=A0ABS9TMZ2_9PSEU|nr:phage holin family protein [Pseudonocardia alaniniphila]MCH6169912.1 phage holin family protein [Pseudonocardia alaniniphila]